MSNPSEPLTLADFLLARIAEDEAAARAVNRGRWNSRVALLDPDLYWHVARQHPARVLAECAAKRAIVEALDEADQEGSAYYERGIGLHSAVARLAAVYADHPDYDEAWRP